MNAAELDRRISFVAPNLVDIGLGETKQDGWTPVAERWAKYTPVSDAEKLRAAAVERQADARFVVRYLPGLADLDSQAVIEFDGSHWEITGAKELGRRQWLEFTAWRLVKTEN